MDYFLIAKIDQLYGKDGFVKLKTYSDFPERFFSVQKVYVDFWGDKKLFIVEDVKDVRGKILIKFKHFETIREVQVLMDKEIYVTDGDLVALPKNQYFIHDLIGSEVIIDEKRFGAVVDVLETKANDVLVILTDEKKEKLMPFVLNYIDKFDAANKKLILNISKEFFEDDED